MYLRDILHNLRSYKNRSSAKSTKQFWPLGYKNSGEILEFTRYHKLTPPTIITQQQQAFCRLLITVILGGTSPLVFLCVVKGVVRFSMKKKRA